MIKVTVLYPNKPGSHFDVDYYLNTHMPLAIRLMTPILKGVSVEIGIAGGAPGQPPPFVALVGFTCESVEEFAAAFAQHNAELMADIPNYTDIEPVIQIGEIRISQ
jgi:uncharacterized protein (TIGR02118 family)